MKELYDVQQLLKKFGIYVYVGKRLWDIEMMLIEIQGLKKSEMISDHEFRDAVLILRREHRIEKKKESDQMEEKS